MHVRANSQSRNCPRGGPHIAVLSADCAPTEDTRQMQQEQHTELQNPADSIAPSKNADPVQLAAVEPSPAEHVDNDDSVNHQNGSFAVGRPTGPQGWSDCCCCCCPRIGNMVVLAEAFLTRRGDTAEYHETCNGCRLCGCIGCTPARRLGVHSNYPLCVVGPYWPVMLCITTPLIAGISGLVGYWINGKAHVAFVIILAILGAATLVSLYGTACCNPGLLPRFATEDHDEPPFAGWTKNDRVGVWRPPKAI